MRVSAGFAAVLLLLTPGLASAQLPLEAVGSRAQGMAGAFVAVADDASAPFWNPAGLATGGPVGAVIDWTRFQNGNRSSVFGGLGSWPLGLSYLRQSATFQGSRFTSSTFGVNVLQTVVEDFVVGANLKLVHGTVEDAGAHSSNEFDLDLGAMANFQKVRVGLTLKNLRQPEFTNAAGIAIKVPREVRAGVAVLPKDGVTLALDLDLDTVGLWDGPRRGIAIGGETRVSKRVMARGGVRWNLEDDLNRPAYSAGGSLQLSASSWLDAHYTYSENRRERAYGVALRAGF
ncbi:MAG: hypothetical protein EPO35_06595 [Acidobacteria bacterium]|nr:MAG: hypothetical protein EPO35_06595 [Acidobacteriota bacterium]